MDYRRILVINEQSIYKNNATGITLRSILSNWPADNILEIRIDNENGNNDGKNIKSICVDNCFPVWKIMVSKKHIISSQMKVTSQRPTRLGKIKKKVRRILINLADQSPMLVKKEVVESIGRFNPEVIYTLGGCVNAMKMSVWVAKRQNIAIVIHIMDDWPHYLQDDEGLCQFIYKKELQKWLRRCYRYSRIALAISPQMAQCYDAETGIKHIPMLNSIDVEKMYLPQKEKVEPFIFTYAGGLHLERWKALKDLSEIIEQVSDDTGYKVLLRIYTSHTSSEAVKREFSPQFVEFCDYVPHNKVKDVYATTDALVHIEVANPTLLGYFRFSISTKIPEYLASNRPMLFYGPSTIGLYEYLRENECAYIADTKEKLREQILQMMSGVNDNKIRQNAIRVARENHSLSHARKIFAEVIEKSCE